MGYLVTLIQGDAACLGRGTNGGAFVGHLNPL